MFRHAFKFLNNFLMHNKDVRVFQLNTGRKHIFKLLLG